MAEVAFDGQGCAISTAATSMLTDELVGKTPEQLLRLDREFILDLLGIEISATRMKCALLGLKCVKGASLGHEAEWEAEGEPGDPSGGGDDLARHKSSAIRGAMRVKTTTANAQTAAKMRKAGIRCAHPPAAETALGAAGSMIQWRACTNRGVSGLMSTRWRNRSGTTCSG